MFCPNCGANNTTEQRFCRSCGLNLVDIAESLLLQVPSAESAELLRFERRLEKFGAIAWYGFEAVLLLGIGALIYTVITGLIISGKNPLVGILLTAFIIFATLTLIYVAINEDLKERKKNLSLRTQKELTEPKTTGKLLEEKLTEPISSVTEVTTNLLLVESKQKTSGELK